MNHKHEKMNHNHKEHSKVKSESIEEREVRSWKKRLVWGWALTIPAVIIMYSEFIFGMMIFSEMIMSIILLVLIFPVVFIVGWPTVKSGIRGLFTFYFNMDSLIALGTIVAYLTGIFSLFYTMQNFSGISGMIMAIFVTGKFIEAKARGRAGQE